jgi:hypothetical protein
MKLTIFDLKKQENSIRKLEARKAPPYILEAYDEGFVDVINNYYKLKLKNLKIKVVTESKQPIDSELITMVSHSEHKFLKEALSKRDEDFLKAFFTMTNLDIVSGRKLPPNASSLIKQGITQDLGLKDLYKKLR